MKKHCFHQNRQIRMENNNPVTKPTDTIQHTAAFSSPAVQAAWTLASLNEGVEGADANALHRELLAQIETVNGGDLKGAEALLTAQASTLDGLFHNLMRRSLTLTEGYYPCNWQEILRLALKAQSQCRVTVESLNALKNPHTVAYVQQANIAHGPQQINNGVAAQYVPEGRR